MICSIVEIILSLLFIIMSSLNNNTGLFMLGDSFLLSPFSLNVGGIITGIIGYCVQNKKTSDHYRIGYE